MKRITSILMALIMVLGLSTTAFATTITINDVGARTYAGYKILNLTTSLKCTNTDGAHKHDDTCYNYAYTVNDNYVAILQAEVYGSAAFWNEASNGTKPDAADKVKDAQIMAYFEGLSSDNATVGKYGTLRDAADRIYRAIKNAGITADADNETLNAANASIAQGYWLIADITNLSNQYEANSLVMVDTAGLDTLVITPKTGLPTVEKKVKDINDSTDNDITDNAWQDSADHDIGDTVPFKLTATLPANVTDYEDYMIEFHDTLSDGLALDPTSFVVYMYATKDAANKDPELDNSAGVVTDAFETPDTADGTFEVSCSDITEIAGVTKDTVFVVYYEATLNENAVIGSAGNPNEVYLEFSNNPYDTDDTGKTEKDKVIVFTYKLTINKTDGTKPLPGAGFTLSKKNSAGTYVVISVLGGEGSNLTTFEWEGLDDGDYKLEETTVPAGYNGMDPVEFKISATHSEGANPALTELKGGNLVDGGFEDTGIIVQTVENLTGTVLPETGARGTMMLIGGGAMFVVVAAVFMVTRKKMSIYAD